MNNNNPPEMEQEPELAPLVCPRCATEFNQEPWPETCPKCNKRLDLPSQLAYCRGVDAFTVGQDMLMKLSPRKRRKNPNSSEEMEGLQYYRQAYSSLQLAFQGELAESQRQLGIRMLASMGGVFQVHSMISPLEFAYWSHLMKELVAQLELVTQRERLETAIQRGPAGLLVRIRCLWRIRRLEKALKEQDIKLRYIEQNIEFVDRPHFRRKLGSLNSKA